MLSRGEERLVRGLKRRKIREAEGLFLVEGVRAVEDLLASGIVLRWAVVSPTLEDTPRGAALAGRLGTGETVRRVEDARLAELAATEMPQGVLAVAEAPRHELAALQLDGPATILVLDAVQDPGNFGTLVRTADAVGAAAVVALPGTVDPWNPKAVRSAAGSCFRVPIVQAAQEYLFEWLREQGFTVYGADAGGEPFDRRDLAPRAALVVGNEGAGLTPAVREAADALLAVPIRGSAESLNVAIAAAILLYHMTRRD